MHFNKVKDFLFKVIVRGIPLNTAYPDKGALLTMKTADLYAWVRLIWYELFATDFIFEFEYLTLTDYRKNKKEWKEIIDIYFSIKEYNIPIVKIIRDNKKTFKDLSDMQIAVILLNDFYKEEINERKKTVGTKLKPTGIDNATILIFITNLLVNNKSTVASFPRTYYSKEVIADSRLRALFMRVMSELNQMLFDPEIFPNFYLMGIDDFRADGEYWLYALTDYFKLKEKNIPFSLIIPTEIDELDDSVVNKKAKGQLAFALINQHYKNELKKEK